MATEALRRGADATQQGSSSAAEVACTHCSLPVPPGFVDAESDTQFCCAGCRVAFEILNAHGLGNYYTFAVRRALPVQASDRAFGEFDHPAFRERYVTRLPDGLSRTELYLEGVHCASCVWLVERMPIVADGVLRAELDVRRSLAVVEWDDARLPLSAVARSLAQLGYTPHPFRGVTRDAMRTREDRAMLVRIGVAGAIAINVMLAAFVLYSGSLNGMDPSVTRLFRWISLALTLPDLIWPGRVFFTGAWASIRTRSLHMDLPVAIALAAGVAQGAVNTMRDAGPVYFDGLALLIFALLVGRFLQQRGQRLATDATELMHAVAPMSSRVVDGDNTRDIPTDALLPGMVLDVRAGESFGADGVVVEGRSSVNAALLTGESRAVRVEGGARVYAGTLNVDAPLRVKVEEAGETSRIGRLMRQVEDSTLRRAPVVALANRVAGVFVAVVLVAAVITFAVKRHTAPDRALDDAIALLIVTCPCALALATPLAISVAMGRAAKRGMLIKGGDALERLATPATLVLDKTGTVTEGATALVAWTGAEWVKPLVLALEEGSSHPIADGFRRAWTDVSAAESTAVRHVVGGGCEGNVVGCAVVVGSLRFVLDAATAIDPTVRAALDGLSPALTPVYVAVDGIIVAVAGLGDRIRDDARASLDALRAAGWRTVLLSGDAPDVVDAVGQALGFAPHDAIGSASPEAKLAIVQRLAASGCVVMVGDGVNDATAIAAASVGIGVHGGAEACLASADIYLTRPGLAPLVELAEGASRTMRVIKRNIAFSIAYNVAGATLAIAGVLTPLVAAVLMPASSLTVVLASWYGTTFSRSRA
ncbi:heavy metal translocating P-type ATPase metal-binding domain-containing protein [soil metagenome]